MTEYTSAQMRAEAHRHGDHVADMLNECADLREQIERAREGVTDAVANKACAIYFGSEEWFEHTEDAELGLISMRRALQSVAHLLPSERGGADSELRQLMADKKLYVMHPENVQDELKPLYEISYGMVLDEKVLFTCQAAHPPAQAAQVDAEKYGQQYRCGCFLGFATKRKIPSHCPQHLRDRQGPALPLTTAEPVAQGEAVDGLLPCPFCSGRCEMTTGEAMEAVWPHGTFHRVFCTSCQTRQLFYRTPEEATAAWNRRAQPRAVPDEFVEDIQRAERLASKSKKLNRERMMGLAVIKHLGHLIAAPPSTPNTTGAGENGNG